jgi:hypothetical protein
MFAFRKRRPKSPQTEGRAAAKTAGDHTHTLFSFVLLLTDFAQVNAPPFRAQLLTDSLANYSHPR